MRRFLFVGLLVIALVSAACGGAATPAPEPTAPPAAEPAAPPAEEPAAPAPVSGDEPIELPEVNPLEVAGDIIVAGSSTVFPLAERMANRFSDEGYSGNLTIDSIGSGNGFQRFCAGETDISNASRPIRDNDRELQACREIGREPIEIRVGTDALAVVVSQENDFIDNATLDQLALIFSDAAETWADVNPDWPAEPIQRFIPDTGSGTFDYFVEEIFQTRYEAMAESGEVALPYTEADFDIPAVPEGLEGEALEEAEQAHEDAIDAAIKRPVLSAANQQLSEDDNVLVQGILGSPYAIGYFGYAYYVENTDVLRVLSIEGVEPTDETVDKGEYPLARPLFMYTTATIMQEKPQVAAFVNFYLTYVNEEISEVGYFPASIEDINKAKQAWLDAN